MSTTTPPPDDHDLAPTLADPASNIDTDPATNAEGYSTSSASIEPPIANGAGAPAGFTAPTGLPQLNLGIATYLESRSAEEKAAGLVHLAAFGGARLFHNSARQPFASLPNAGGSGRHTVKVDGQEFRGWLEGLLYRYTSRCALPGPMSLAVNMMKARAIYDGELREVHVGRAALPGTTVIDLRREDGQVAVVADGSVTITDNVETLFLRPPTMHPLPMPVRGGDIRELQSLFGLPQDHFILIVVFLLASMRANGPYQVLLLLGEHGSAKSTLARLLKLLIDPTGVPLRAPPTSEHDLIIAAQNNILLVFDNVSKIPGPLSDACCRLSTGGGVGTRRLFTDDEEAVLEARRPLIVTSITEVITRADLLDRTLIIRRATVPPAQRRPEAEVLAEFELARPRLLGALLDLFAAAMERLPHVHLPELPRMADFALLGTAAEGAMGLEPGAFMAAYHANLADGHQLSLEGSVLPDAIDALVGDDGAWEGTATQLLTLVRMGTPKHLRGQLPKVPKTLSCELRRLVPGLRSIGIVVEFDAARSPDRKRERLIQIRREG